MSVSESTANRFQRLWHCVERDLGWSQSELGRRLGMTPSAISFLASGRTNPSGRTLRALEMLLEREAPGILAEVDESLRSHGPEPTGRKPLSPTLSIASKGSQKGFPDRPERVQVLREMPAEYGRKMEALPPEKRAIVEQVVQDNRAKERQLIDILSGISSAVADAAIAGQAAASALARLGDPESRPSRGAGGPSARKSGRGRGIGGRKDARPGTPGPAPE